MLKRFGSEEARREHFRQMGSAGGKASNTGGFAGNPKLAAKLGAIGGRKSRRTGIKNKYKVEKVYEEKKSRWNFLKK